MSARRLHLTLATAGLAALGGCAAVRSPPFTPMLPDLRPADASAPPAQATEDPAARRAPVVTPGQGARLNPPEAGVSAEGGFVINLSDADLVEASRVILGDLLGDAFTVDPGVQGRVTLSGAGSLSEADLIALFETALRQNGVALLKQGEAWRVAPLADAQGAGRLLAAGEPGYGVTAIPLRFMGADAARALIEGLVVRAGGVRSEPGRNMLLVVGTRAERANAVETITALDVDWIAAMSVGVFPVENADPQTLIAEIETLFQSGQAGAASGALRLRPLARLNAVLAVAGSTEMLNRVGEWIARLDVETGDTTVLRTYFLDSGKAEETARLLNELFTGQAPPTAVAPPGEAGASGSTAAVARSSFAPTQPGGARIIADKLNNALLVLADPSGHRLVQRALNDIDRLPPQVLVDATIVEVTLSDRLRYGVQWFFETNGIAGVADSGRGGLSSGNGLDADGVFPGFNFLLESGDAARVAIDALSAVTNVSVRSSPSLIVMDNQSATLSVGDRVPVVTRQASGIETENSPIINQIEFRDTGVILTVTPRVSSTSVVTLEIEQEVSSVSETVNTGALTPTISQRRIASTVAVRSGQTLALGGLIDESGTKARSGVPLLSRAPLIGPLFSATNNNAKRTELIVFLTPRVIRTEDDVQRAAEELRERMTSILDEDARRGGGRRATNRVEPRGGFSTGTPEAGIDREAGGDDAAPAPSPAPPPDAGAAPGEG